MNDLSKTFDLIKTSNNNASGIVLRVDNGPDFAPNSLLNLFYYGRLWREKKLDVMLIGSYAPYNSK